MTFCKILFCFLFLLTALIVGSSHIFAGIYNIFLKKRPAPNLKSFRYQIQTSVKRSGKQLSSKKNFTAFLHISCSNFRLKLCQKPQSYKNCQTNQIWRGLGQVRSKKLFPEIFIHKILQINSSFYVKQRITGRLNFSFSGDFTSTDKIFIPRGGPNIRQLFYEVLRLS